MKAKLLFVISFLSLVSLSGCGNKKESQVPSDSSESKEESDSLPTENEYTIRFVDEDGSELQVSKVKEGVLPVYSGEIPTKESTVQYDYAFDRWIPEIVIVEGDATYTASYTQTTRSYLISFVDEDGTPLHSEYFEYGTYPAYNGETPTKAETVSTVYTFAGWDKPLSMVTGEETYTARYSEVTKSYMITFLDDDDSVLQSSLVPYGTLPTPPSDPEKEPTVDKKYTFTGWDKEIVEVVGDATYKATYIEEARTYLIKFVNPDGSELKSEEVAYGEMPTPPENPTMEGTDYVSYEFIDWDKGIAIVTGEETYTALYELNVASYNFTEGDVDSIIGAKAMLGSEDKTEFGIHTKAGSDIGPTHSRLEYNPYEEKGDYSNRWTLGLPLVNFTKTNNLTVSFNLVNWAGDGRYALSDAELDTNYLADQGGSGKIYASYESNTLYVVFSYKDQVLSEIIYDENIVHGRDNLKIHTMHKSAGGNAYFGITDFDVATPLDGIHFPEGEWSVEREANYYQTGLRHANDLLHGYVEEEFYYEPKVSVNDAGGSYAFILNLKAEGLPVGQYTFDKSSLKLLRGNDVINPRADLPNDLFNVWSEGSAMQVNDGWFKYLFSGSFSDPASNIFNNGDIIRIENAVVVGRVDGTLSGVSFFIKKLDIALVVDETTGNFHSFELIDTIKFISYEFGGTSPWYKNNGLQFYANHSDYVPKYDDSPNNFGKFRGTRTDCVRVKRGENTYNISKANDGWIDAIKKDDNNTNDRYYVSYSSGSIDLSSIGGSIQSGDIVTIEGIFYSSTMNCAIRVMAMSSLYTQNGDAWSITVA